MKLARLFGEPFSDYPQTWYYMPRRGLLRRLLQAAHGLWGHTPSKTEWGYGGGDTVDTWCRWCDKLTSIPMSEARFRFPQLAEWKGLVAQVKRGSDV